MVTSPGSPSDCRFSIDSRVVRPVQEHRAARGGAGAAPPPRCDLHQGTGDRQAVRCCAWLSLYVGELARIACGVTGERGRERGGGGGGRRAVPAHLPFLQERCESEWADVLDQNRLCGFPTSRTHRRKYTPTSSHWQLEAVEPCRSSCMWGDVKEGSMALIDLLWSGPYPRRWPSSRVPTRRSWSSSWRPISK